MRDSLLSSYSKFYDWQHLCCSYTHSVSSFGLILLHIMSLLSWFFSEEVGWFSSEEVGWFSSEEVGWSSSDLVHRMSLQRLVLLGRSWLVFLQRSRMVLLGEKSVGPPRKMLVWLLASGASGAPGFWSSNDGGGWRETLRLAIPLSPSSWEVTKCGLRHQFPVLERCSNVVESV